MKLRKAVALLGATLVLGGVIPSVASAATEFGDPCPAVTGIPTPYGIFAYTAAGDPLPLTAPVGGILTKWRIEVTSPGPPKAAAVTLKTLRLTGAESLLVTGESSGSIAAGSNSFAARIPIQPGDHLGIFGSDPEVGTPVCAGVAENKLGIFDPATTPGGSSMTASGESAFRIPVVGTIEPDADNDGFGDETQDACPQSATTQIACPVVTLSASATATKKLVTVLVTATTAANVTVNGKASLGKGKKAKLKGGTKAVAPGAFTKFKLKFPAKLVKRLKELPPSKKLTLKVTSSATNVAAAPSKKIIKVKLKGQGPHS
ncbi:MAG TPA: hypothetical protein VFN18_11375 [Solirubrobacterales bacterium]|nr:hypothetical protein [Solirubrobacterales bacterium]